MKQHYPFKNMPLPYGYGGLEPYIDEKTMMLHHDRHLQTYIDNLNKTLSSYPQYQDWTLEELIKNVGGMPYEIRDNVRNNAGGVYNHFFYFDEMRPKQMQKPMTSEMETGMKDRFGSFDGMKDELKKAALSVFGSGYAWLVTDRNGVLQVVTTKNQDNPLESGLCPVLNIDVWEHAYYLKHYNVRAAYIDDWFNVVDWGKISENYRNCG